MQAHIKSQMTLRLGLYCLSAFSLALAGVLIVFAPPGRETLTLFVGGALFVVACGCAGFGAVAVKVPGFNATASTASGPSGRSRKAPGHTHDAVPK
jgi:hypothetical protein